MGLHEVVAFLFFIAISISQLTNAWSAGTRLDLLQRARRIVGLG